jgi:hypothetical protein
MIVTVTIFLLFDLNSKHVYPRKSQFQDGRQDIILLLLFLPDQKCTQLKRYEFVVLLSAKVRRPEITWHVYAAHLNTILLARTS